MENNQKVVYMVTYLDDFNKKHITFVESLSDVKFLEDRFGNKISYKYFDNLFKYPDNKTHKRMFREFKKMVMD